MRAAIFSQTGEQSRTSAAVGFKQFTDNNLFLTKKINDADAFGHHSLGTRNQCN
jgi:hypothetical protein